MNPADPRSTPDQDRAGASPSRSEQPHRPAPPATGDPSLPGSADPAASAPPSAPPAEPKLERPHPVTPLIRGWVIFAAILFAMGRELAQNLSRQESPPWLLLVGGVLLLSLLAGLGALLGWWFTRFVIDDHELRIETGVLNKTSKRVPFAKIQAVEVNQPLAARLFGLAELRIEAGGTGGGINLRYLKRTKAYRMRDYLITRAHGVQTTVEQSDHQPLASAFTDLSAHDRVLVTLQPGILIGGLVTSSEFMFTVGGLVLAVVVSTWLGAGIAALGGLVPLIIAIPQLITRRVISQFNYTLAATPDGGLRVSRGLANLTSQSIPIDRIQGVSISQSWVWRHLLRFHRVDIDLLGQHGGDSGGRISGMLLPVSRTEQVRAALAHLLPEAHDETIELVRVPRRAAWLRPIGWRTMRYGWNAEVLVNEFGWLQHRRVVVPHAKTQSVRLSQGPVQRLLRLATVHTDTTPGPVQQNIRHLDIEDARALMTAQLPRAAAARRRG